MKRCPVPGTRSAEEDGADGHVRASQGGHDGERVKALGSQSTALRARRKVLAQELDEADLTAPTTEELSDAR
jgi:hypothetical protein